MTGYPDQPTPTSEGDVSPADVMGRKAPREKAPDGPGEVPERTAPEKPSAEGTSETMPPVEGVYDAEAEEPE
ncbi:MAG TPA: hypothetical protein VGH85_02045 [Mycobacteriales bacterium]|jgi:hypothetical protein